DPYRLGRQNLNFEKSSTRSGPIAIFMPDSYAIAASIGVGPSLTYGISELSGRSDVDPSLLSRILTFRAGRQLQAAISRRPGNAPMQCNLAAVANAGAVRFTIPTATAPRTRGQFGIARGDEGVQFAAGQL